MIANICHYIMIYHNRALICNAIDPGIQFQTFTTPTSIHILHYIPCGKWASQPFSMERIFPRKTKWKTGRINNQCLGPLILRSGAHFSRLEQKLFTKCTL